MFEELSVIIDDRKNRPRSDSYTSSLFAKGEDVILKKIGEEAMEVILAAKGQGNERLVEESADLIYHLLVLLSFYGLSIEDVEVELYRRHAE